jgi:hypothetical protein
MAMDDHLAYTLLNPPLLVIKARSRSRLLRVLVEERQAMGAVVKVRVPYLDLGTVGSQHLDHHVEHRGLADPLPPDSDDQHRLPGRGCLRRALGWLGLLGLNFSHFLSP